MAAPKALIPLITYMPHITTWQIQVSHFLWRLWFWFIDICTAAITYFMPRRSVPRVEDNLLMHSAKSLASMIRSGKVTAYMVVKTYINRINLVDPYINAVVRERFQEALHEARQIDLSIASGMAPDEMEKPLLGVPFTVKDAVFFEGFVTTAGMAIRRQSEARETATVLRKLIDAGAILLAITNVSEACMWWECYNTVFGTTRNPHDLRRTPGGSSGGEGALLGSCGSVIGVGTDIGGSIRMPAAFCGIFGHKPSKGVVPDDCCYPPVKDFQKEMHAAGPMCRFAEDVGPLLYIMADANLRDDLNLFDSPRICDLKIYYLEDLCAPYLHPIENDVRRALWRVISHFEIKYSSVCTKLNLPLLYYAWTLWFNDMSVPGSSFRKVLSDGEYEMNTFVEFCRILIGIGRHTIAGLSAIAMEDTISRFHLIQDTSRWKALRAQLKAQLEDVLGDNGVLLLPAHPTVAPFHCTPLLMPFNFTYTAILNSLFLPATVCPVGVSRNRMPLSVQVVAAERQDRLTIAVANDLQRAFGGSVLPQ